MPNKNKKLFDDQVVKRRYKTAEELAPTPPEIAKIHRTPVNVGDAMARLRHSIEPLFQDVPKNSQTATGEYYAGKVETIDYLENMMVKLLENNVPPERAYDVECALKYLSPRLGAKSDQPIQLDLMKAENYVHRARTGKWLDKEFLDPFSS